MDLNIKWSIDHDRGPNSYMLVGDCNGSRFVEGVNKHFWGIPLMYKKWLITLRFKILNK